jgi:hypothetical protein
MNFAVKLDELLVFSRDVTVQEDQLSASFASNVDHVTLIMKQLRSDCQFPNGEAQRPHARKFETKACQMQMSSTKRESYLISFPMTVVAWQQSQRHLKANSHPQRTQPTLFALNPGL